MVHIDETIVVASAADLRTNLTFGHKTVVALLTGLNKVGDGHGGYFVYDPLNAQVDNAITVIRPTGVTTGAWVRLIKYQDTVHFEQNGGLIAGSFSRLVARGGYYGTSVAKLGTSGSTASTVAVAVNGTTVATITFAANATAGTIAYVAGTTISAANGAKFTFTVTAGTGAADLTMVLDC